MTKPLCIVIGVGPGNGASFARRFSSDAHHVAILARNANYLRLHPGCCAQASAAGIRCAEWREGVDGCPGRGLDFSAPGSTAAGFGEVLHSCRAIRQQSSAVGLG